MDTFENTCIPHDELARYPTNSTAVCCNRCLATRGCFSCEGMIFDDWRVLPDTLTCLHCCFQGWCDMMKECAT
jgi:hypothetical protein